MAHSAETLDSVEIDLDDDPGGLVGHVLADRFRVKSLLGTGGIGRVYRAEHLGLGRHVALKVLLEHYACVPELQRRFEREAMALSALRHPNIVTITDFVATRGVTFLVMELVEGPDLDDVVDAGLAPEDALDIFEQILSCLAYAHARGVIHRDLKPQNVLIRELPGGRLHAVVLDFGLAKFMDGTGKHANLTKTGLIVGTPAYMAPEQASGGRADARSDVYAAGVLLFELLTGVLPFDGEQSDVLRQHLLRAPPTLASACPGAEVAPELEALLARTLAKDPGDRYADAGALLDAFLTLPDAPFSRTSGPRPRRVERAASAATELAVAATAPPSPGPRVPAWAWGLGGALASALLVSALFLALGGSDEPDAPPSAATGAQSEPTPDDPLAAALAEEAAEEAGEVPDDVTEPPDEAANPTLDEEADAPLDDEEDEAEEASGPTPPPANRPRARNPWRGSIPSTLARVRRRVSRGHPITKRHLRQVARYRNRHPSDVRATLVLAHAYMARGWISNARAQYLRAYRRDASTRADARMKRDLVRMAALADHHEAATDALIEIYGAEALPLLRRAASREGDAERRARLQAALARVTAAG